jgi:hypothetical protein
MKRRQFIYGGLAAGAFLSLPTLLGRKFVPLNEESTKAVKKNTIVYGVSQSGTLLLAAALKDNLYGQEYNFLGNYFNVYGSVFNSDVQSSPIPYSVKETNPKADSYKLNFKLENQKIVQFKDFSSAPFSAKAEVQRREQLLKASQGSNIVILSSWVDAHDQTQVCDRLLNDSSNDVYVVIPKNIEELLLKQGMTELTDIWSRPAGLPKLDPSKTASLSSVVFEDVKTELQALKKRLTIPHAKFIFSSQLESREQALKAIGKQGSSKWKGLVDFEPEYAKPLQQYFTNRDEIAGMVKQLEKIIS